MYDSLGNPARIVSTFGVSGTPSGPTTNQPANFARALWLYETAEDTHIQCEVAGYFSNGGSLGMQVGDLLMVSSSVANGGGVTLHQVTAVTPQSTGPNIAGGSGFYPPGAATIGGASAAQNSVATGLVATGTTQTTALALGADINMLATVAANTGVVLGNLVAGAIQPTLNPGDVMTVFNGGANACKVYPPTGGTINALGANAAYSLATATPLCEITCVSPTLYLARQSA